MIISRVELYEAICHRVSVIAVSEETGEIVFASPRVEQLFGYKMAGELVGEPVEILVPDALKDVHATEHRAKFAADPTPRLMGAGARHLRGQRKDGSTFPITVELYGVKVSGVRLVIAKIIDMTTRPESSESGGEGKS